MGRTVHSGDPGEGTFSDGKGRNGRTREEGQIRKQMEAAKCLNVTKSAQ